MIDRKNKLLALAILGGLAASPMLANAGVVAVEGTSATKTPTFSTDMFGPASATDSFYLPDVAWYPGAAIPAGSTARFNLGGIAGVAASYAVNGVNQNNFVLRVGSTPLVGAFLAPTTTVGVGAVLADVSAAVAAAEAAAVAVGVTLTTTNMNAMLGAAASALITAAQYNAVILPSVAVADPANSIGAAFKAVVDAAVAAPLTSSYAGLAGSSLVANAPVNASYTNGDSATWFSTVFGTTAWVGLDGTSNIFSIVATPVGGVEAIAKINIGLTGSAALGGDAVALSLESGRYTNNVNLAVPFATGPDQAKRVKISNLTPIGFNQGGASVNMTVTASHPTFGSLDQTGNTSVIARSASPLIVSWDADTSPTTATVSGDLPATINTASSELGFSIHGAAGSWFGNALTVPGSVINHLGSFQTSSGLLAAGNGVVYQTGLLPASIATYRQVSNASGARYGYTSTDTKAVSFSLNSATAGGAFAAAGSFWLSASNNCVSVNAGDVTVTAASNVVANTTVLTANAAIGADVQDGTAYTLCAKTTTANAVVIEAVQATMNFSILNNKTLEPHYQDPAAVVAGLGSWIRNGCSVTFFNVPANGPAKLGLADVPYLRFTNTTVGTVAGTVRASAWNQNGTQLGLRGALLTSPTSPAAGLIGHQTGVYNVNDLSAALGLAPVAGANPWVGRARVVLSGGFASCEGQNLISAANGTLVNVTSTTNANQNTHNVTTDTVGWNGNNSN